MFPNDAITTFTEVAGTGNTVVVSGTAKKTILGVSMQQGNNASATVIQCGTTPIAKNYATNFSYVPENYSCQNTINIQKTGNDSAAVIITYVPYKRSDFATTTAQVAAIGYNPSTTISSSSNIRVYGSMSAGEVLIAVMLLMFLILKISELVIKGLSKIVTKKRYLQYGGGDVEIRDDY